MSNTITSIMSQRGLWRDSTGNLVGVDEPNKRILGIRLASEGNFKSGRGRLNRQALREIVDRLDDAEPLGTPSNFTHPHAADPDSLGDHLGRFHNARVDGNDVRADLSLDDTAMRHSVEGGTPKGKYILDLAKSDPKALGASLQFKANRKLEYDPQGRAVRDSDGNVRKEVWHPKKILSVDLVANGDAVGEDGLLGLPPDAEILAFRERHARRKARIAAEQLAAENELTMARERHKWRRMKMAAGL